MRAVLAAAAAARAASAAQGARAAPLPVLSLAERSTLAAVANALVPGAAAAGVADFVAGMLERPDPLLGYRFTGFTLPAREFYRASLGAIEKACARHYGASTGEISAVELERFVRKLAHAQLQPWDGPPQALVYFVLRNDAIDAAYGVPDAYASLQIPYMAHIEPPRPWWRP